VPGRTGFRNRHICPVAVRNKLQSASTVQDIGLHANVSWCAFFSREDEAPAVPGRTGFRNRHICPVAVRNKRTGFRNRHICPVAVRNKLCAKRVNSAGHWSACQCVVVCLLQPRKRLAHAHAGPHDPALPCRAPTQARAHETYGPAIVSQSNMSDFIGLNTSASGLVLMSKNPCIPSYHLVQTLHSMLQWETSNISGLLLGVHIE